KIGGTPVDGPTSPFENDPSNPAFLTFKDIAANWIFTMNNDPRKVVMCVELSGIIRQVQNISVFQQTPINQKVTVNKQVFTFPNSIPIKDNCGNSTTLNYINSISWNDLRYSD